MYVNGFELVCHFPWTLIILKRSDLVLIVITPNAWSDLISLTVLEWKSCRGSFQLVQSLMVAWCRKVSRCICAFTTFLGLSPQILYTLDITNHIAYISAGKFSDKSVPIWTPFFVNIKGRLSPSISLPQYWTTYLFLNNEFALLLQEYWNLTETVKEGGLEKKLECACLQATARRRRYLVSIGNSRSHTCP